MRIGIYSPNWIGDSVIALTFVQSIRAFESDAEIFIVCKEWVAGVYQEHPAIDAVLSFSSVQLSGLANIYKMGSSLKKYNFDKFFTLTDSFRSALSCGYPVRKRDMVTDTISFYLSYKRTNDL